MTTGEISAHFVVKVRDGQVGNWPIYPAIGVSLAGEKDVLGLWAGTYAHK